MSTIPPVNTPPVAVVPPANQQQAPVQQTEEQLIEAAVSKLSRTAVDNLWEDNVTKAAWYAKIYGLFCYAWNRSEAVKKDEQFGATINEFNNATVDLVKKVFNRSIRPAEATALGIAPLQFNNSTDQLKYVEFDQQAEKALEAFYELFKKRVAQEGINDLNLKVKEYGVFSAAAQKIIQDGSNSKELLSNSHYPHAVPTKIATTIHGFNHKIFNDMVNGYASQPLADITVDSFQQRSNLIKGFFPSIKETQNASQIEIETQMRKAIKKKYNTTEFDKIIAEYTNPAVNAPRFITAKSKLQDALNTEKTSLEAELAVLRGTNGFNGTLNTAHGEMTTAEAEKNAAFTALLVAFNNQVAVNANDQAATVAAIAAFLVANPAANGLPVTVGNLQALVTAYNDKAAVFKTKKEAFDKLDARRKEIAEYAFGSNVPNAGRLHVVTTSLQDAALTNAARFEMARMADFYRELNTDITDYTGQQRSPALHAIFNRKI